MLEKAPVLVAALSTTLYVVGYLVVTGFLGSKGVHDHPFVSARYIMAGGLAAICASMYYFFVWRKTERRARIEMVYPANFTAAFKGYITYYFILEDLFGCAFFSIWLVGIFGPDTNAQFYGFVAGAVYLIDQSMFTHFGSKYPKTYFVVSGLLLGISITAFVLSSAVAPPLLAVFTIASSFTFISTAVLTSEDWSQNRDRVYGATYLALSAAIAAVGFGTTVYGELSPRFGGGQPPSVKIVFSQEADISLRAQIEAASAQIFLLNDDKEQLTLELRDHANKQQVLRLDRGLVQAIQFERVVRKDGLFELISTHLAAMTASAAPASTLAKPAPAP